MEASPIDDPFGALQRERRVIVVVDVVESVRLIEQHELDVIDRWRRFVNEVVTEVLPQHGGRLVKSLGDGMLLEFGEVPRAMHAASSLHMRIGKYNAGRGHDSAILLRVGAHRAEVVIDELDVYGAGVNLAARLATLGGPAETIVSPEVRDELIDGLDADVEDLGDCYVKHFPRTVRAYRIGGAGHRPIIVGRRPQAGLKPAIAVIPMSSRVPGRATAFIGELIGDRVIAALSQSASIEVLSRLTTSRFRGRRGSMQELGQLLGATYVLSGAYIALSDRVQVQYELSDTRTNRVVRADGIEGPIATLASMDDPLSQGIAIDVGTAIVATEVARAGQRPVPSLESYTLLLGSIALMHRAARSDFDRARAMLEHLVERDPDEPLPRAWLAKWYGIRAAQGWTADPRDDARCALEHVSRALDTEPDNSLAWTIKGLIHGYIGKDLDRAGEAYEAALAANPNESLAWLYTATLNAWQDRGPAAKRAADKALRLSPFDPLRYYYDSLAATSRIVAGDVTGAIELAQRSLRANQAHASTWRTLTIAQVLAGEIEAARSTAQRLLTIEPALTVSRFRERYPGRASTHAGSFCEALRLAGVPE